MFYRRTSMIDMDESADTDTALERALSGGRPGLGERVDATRAAVRDAAAEEPEQPAAAAADPGRWRLALRLLARGCGSGSDNPRTAGCSCAVRCSGSGPRPGPGHCGSTCR